MFELLSTPLKVGALVLGAVLVPLQCFAQTGGAFSDGIVKIGVLGEYGVGRDLGGPGSVTAAKLAAEDFQNRVSGKAVEIVAADHQGKPDVAVALARKWFDTEQVDAITDLAVSSVGLAVADLAAERNRAVLISGAATSDLTGSHCSLVATHWADDTYALSTGIVREVASRAGKDWYFVAVDYAFGTAMVRDASDTLAQVAGKVLGKVRYPYGTSDFSSYLLTAQASGAKVIALASTGTDTVNAVKQAREFGLIASGQVVVGMLTFIADVHALGLENAEGLYLASEYYWDEDETSRAFAKRFYEKEKRMPTKLQAATYAAVKHYLGAVEAAGTDDAKTVNAQMRKMTVDFFGKSATIRQDGRVMYDLPLYRVKAPTPGGREWDYYEKVATIGAEQAFRPERDGGCKLVK